MSCLLPAIVLPAMPAGAAPRWFRVTDDGWFVGWRRQLQELVDQVPGKPPSRVCIVGERMENPSAAQAYVVWRAQHRLIIWWPSRGDPHSLVEETHVLDLWRDVVAGPAQIDGSTYLVDRAWVADIERRCRISGVTLLLSPRGKP